MKRGRSWFVIAGSAAAVAAVVAAVWLLRGDGLREVELPPGMETAPLVVDYPLADSIFPPDMEPPTFLWRDPGEEASSWLVEVSFADGGEPVRVEPGAEKMRVGEIDPRAVGETNELPQLTPDQAASRTWKPDRVTWAEITRRSVDAPATATFYGFPDATTRRPVSMGRVSFTTSKDPVGAPIFYRDVPLMPSDTEKGVIKPLSQARFPLIAWRLRNVSEPESRVLMEGLHTCSNCHSFSRDGSTLGMDLDGPKNTKALYALAEVKPKTTITDDDVVAWSSFRDDVDTRIRVGFMSQVSPDGRYVVTTIKPPDPEGAKGSPSKSDDPRKDWIYYVANFKTYKFLQVFYPTRGILVWYDRETNQLRPLPGADDPRYVHTNATWSPDGDYLVFARAEARAPYPEGAELATYAGDPNETPIQYDLYRIPFNGGEGGVAEPVEGASGNGMSNSFPKISPDGRWIVWVQAKNGQLMRPDGKLHIVPAEGGEARLMRCNTPLMNSWHSFSPNGRWMVFSSKSRSPYTQMFLTHIDEEGRSSPALLVENATAANRAVNIPEFVNIPPDGMLEIDNQAAEFYKLFNIASDLTERKQYKEAVLEWEKALALHPEDDRAQNSLGSALAATGRVDEALPHFEKALELNPENDEAHNSYGTALLGLGRVEEAVPHYRRALELNPDNPEARGNLGVALARQGDLDGALPHLQRAVALDPEYLAARANLGLVLVQKGQYARAITSLEEGLALQPDSAELHDSLGLALLSEGRAAEAAPHFRRAIETAPELGSARENLGRALLALGRTREALVEWRELLLQEPDRVPVLTQTAWILATSPDAAVRNGQVAVGLAEHAARLTGGREVAVLDALAASYAEVGRFSEAAQTARQAAGLAREQGRGQLATTLDRKAAHYQSQRPLREGASVGD